AAALGERVLACFAAPYVIGGEKFAVSASVGIALFDGIASGSDLIRHADEAMYRAKGRGRNRVELFDATAGDDALLRMHTETALRRALEVDELRVHYQPIFDLETRRPVGVEALVRWQHPTGGLLLPGDFIGVAEDSGLIVPIGDWVLRHAWRQVAAWNARRADDEQLGLSVNLSTRQLAESSVVTMVQEALASEGPDVQGPPLTLEVTETFMLRDPEAAALRLAELCELGLDLAIDDFGTGFSSLSYLRRFPVSVLKIDRSFVAGLGESVEDEAIVRAVLQLGRTLGLQVVAEGVETDAQLGRLRSLGCTRAQGYLLGRPQSADDLGLAGPARITDPLELVAPA
nr:GGDEF domain-containing phosphodiesterase [Actinomycetota bacterium]